MRVQIRLHLDDHLTPLPLHSWDVAVYDDAGDREAIWTGLVGPFDTADEGLASALRSCKRYLEGAPRQGTLPLPDRRPDGP